MMKNECDEVRRTAPAGKLDRLQDTMDQRLDDDAEYLALEAKHAGQRLLKVMQVIAETEELDNRFQTFNPD